MVVIRSLIGVFALLLAGLMLGIGTPQIAAAEISAPRPATDIGVIHFRGGRLVQSTEQYGRWFEKRNNGAINYEFFETASTATSIELTGPNGEVKLFVDLPAKAIKGQWPGQTPIKIYTITKIERLVFIQVPPTPHPDDCVVTQPDPSLPCPVLPGQPPVTHPPVTQPTVPPVPHPPVPNPYVPLPKDMKSATYAGGQFMALVGGVWEESTANGEVFRYQIIGYDKQSLYLHDPSRRAFVTLEPSAKLARLSVNGGYLNIYQTLTAISGQQVTPMPPQPDGKLSEAERLACVGRGGFVERAGLLGAERCTTPFSDGGLVCTDSAQCQGQCRGDLNSMAGATVTGVCQANDNPFGCYSEVVGGQAGPGLCVD